MNPVCLVAVSLCLLLLNNCSHAQSEASIEVNVSISVKTTPRVISEESSGSSAILPETIATIEPTEASLDDSSTSSRVALLSTDESSPLMTKDEMPHNLPIDSEGANVLNLAPWIVLLMLIASFLIGSRLLNFSAISWFEKTRLGLVLKKKINEWLITWDLKNQSQFLDRVSAITEMPMSNAVYSYQIQERDKLYRIMDIVLLFLGVRHIPPECVCDKDCTTPPVILDESIIVELLNEEGEVTSIIDHPKNKALLESWKVYFSELCNLIRHDDMLNWQKFHYVMVIFGVIISAFVLSFNGQASSVLGQWARILLSLTGVALSLIADRTFQEGLRCLRGHRRKLLMLERKGINKSAFLFGTCPFNQRDGLELCPTIIFIISIGMLSIAIFQGVR